MCVCVCACVCMCVHACVRVCACVHVLAAHWQVTWPELWAVWAWRSSAVAGSGLSSSSWPASVSPDWRKAASASTRSIWRHNTQVRQLIMSSVHACEFKPFPIWNDIGIHVEMISMQIRLKGQ